MEVVLESLRRVDTGRNDDAFIIQFLLQLHLKVVFLTRERIISFAYRFVRCMSYEVSGARSQCIYTALSNNQL